MITLTREEAQQVLDALEWTRYRGGYDYNFIRESIETLRARLSAPEPNYRDVVIKGDLWRIEFLPDHAVSVVLVRANYEPKPVPCPVAWQGVHDKTDLYYRKPVQGDVRPLYTTPPQREWQRLTDEEIEKIFLWQEWSEDFDDFEHIARAIEAKLKEKNNG